MSLKNKFRSMVAIAAAGLLALTGMWLHAERSDLLSERTQKARSLVGIAYSVISEQYDMEIAGKVSRADAQKRALDALRGIRYENDNYFWVNDTHPTMLMHPAKPDLDGKDLTDYKDPTGKAMFVAMVGAAKDPAGGFVYYMWPKPGKDQPVQKLSFVRAFGPWGWIVGTGIYIDDIDASWHASARVAGGLALGCLVFLFMTSIHVWRSIFSRLHDMAARMQDMAHGEGDLTQRLAVGREDEVAELARWFNTFVDKLQEILSQVSGSSRSLATAGESISAAAVENAHGAELQSEQTNQVAAAMREMAATVQQVSENSNGAAGASRKAAEAARQGGKVVDESLSRMRSIATSVGQTAQKIQELGKRSEEIGRITSVIDDIANQTNLLALNAAIEAAHAGDQGRGFAVVADEVGKLAERTSAATREITQMIGSIQVETRSAVAAMQAGTKEVQLGVEATHQAGSSSDEIIQMSEQVGQMVMQIATAATQQAATTDEINGNIEQIAKITATSAASAKEATESLRNMSALATGLQSLMAHFKLEAETDGTPPPASTGTRPAKQVYLDAAVATVPSAQTL